MKNKLTLIISLVLTLILSVSVVALASDEIVVAFLAPDFMAQGGGEVQFPSDRGYPCISHWDYTGHWLEWEIQAPAAGIYIPIFRYASGTEVAERRLSVNGEDKLNLVLFSTGGFGRKPSEWGFAMAEPINLAEGKNIIRIENSTAAGNKAGLNLAWVGFVSIDLIMLDDAQLIEVVDNKLNL